jgi:TPR repeat protein
MNGRKIMVFTIIVFLLFSVYPTNIFCLFGGLKEKIQTELDKNPFLAKEQLKLRVTEEKNGYVTIDVYEGSRKLREAIHQINGQMFSRDHLSDRILVEDRTNQEKVRVIAGAIEIIKKIDGLKQVSLTAPINTTEDQSADLAERAVKLYKEKKYTESIIPLTKSAELGNARAQLLLADMYFEGHPGIQKDYKMAKNWLEKAILKGDPLSYNGMAWFLAVCQDPKYQNGKKAVEYAQKAISLDNTNWEFYDTLAAAYARNGKYKEAIDSQEKAIMLLTKTNSKQDDKNMLDSRMRLNLYKSGKPYTQE